jgi:23S rRNA (uracil1939-C5)-methyltransferase
MRKRFSKRSTAPSLEEAPVTIDSLGAQGDGTARINGQIVHVPLALPGDHINLKYDTKALRSAGFSLLSPGPDRIPPPCLHFSVCGGCQLQHLSENAYKTWKRGLVTDAVARAGGDPALVADLVSVPIASRRRAVFTAIREGKKFRLGFRHRQGHSVENITECLVLTPRLAELLPPLRASLETETNLRELRITAAMTETGIDLVIEAETGLDLRLREKFAQFAQDQDLARLSWQQGNGTAEPVAMRRPPILTFGKVAVTLPPGTFLQPSQEGGIALQNFVSEAIPRNTSRIADLYAGCGPFTFSLAGRAIIHAVEENSEAVNAVTLAARRGSLVPWVTAEQRDLDRRPLQPDELAGFDTVIFDPPRAGAAAQAAALAQSQVPVVIAISCNPATFARDARTLIAGGYTLDKVMPLDQFPWSTHVELAAKFIKPE